MHMKNVLDTIEAPHTFFGGRLGESNPKSPTQVPSARYGTKTTCTKAQLVLPLITCTPPQRIILCRTIILKFVKRLSFSIELLRVREHLVGTELVR